MLFNTGHRKPDLVSVDSLLWRDVRSQTHSALYRPVYPRRLYRSNSAPQGLIATCKSMRNFSAEFYFLVYSWIRLVRVDSFWGPNEQEFFFFFLSHCKEHVSISNIQRTMVWGWMLSFMSLTDFEILQPSYHSSIESLSLCSIRKRRPTKLFRRSVLLRLTSKNIGSALPASQKAGQRSNNEAMPVIREGACVWSGIPRSFSQNWTEGSFLKISLEKKKPNPQNLS